MKKLKFLLVAAVAMFSGLVGLNHNTSAAGRAVAVSPMSQRIILAPGETYRGNITVANPATSTEDLKYLVTVGSYSIVKTNEKDDYGDFSIDEVTELNELVNWITVDNPQGTIAPNGETTVSFSIDVPSNAPAGAQYASLLVREDTDDGAADGNMAVNEVMQMASILYAEVTGTTVSTGAVLSNDIPSILLSGTLETTSLVKNTGNIYTDAEYTLQIWPLFSDEEIYTNEEEPETKIVLPDTERYNTQSYDMPLFGIFRVKQTVKIFDEVSELEKTILVCPLWLLFIIILAVAGIIIWLVMRMQGRKK